MSSLCSVAVVGLALTAACYSKPPALHLDPDASTGTPLMPPTDATAGGVTVSVTIAGVPISGAPVYFQGADSSLLLATATDAGGAVGYGGDPNGGFVTVVLHPETGSDAQRVPEGIDQLYTFASVAAGDHLRVDLADTSSGEAVQYATTLSALDPGAVAYNVFSACTDGATSLDANGLGTLVLAGCGTSTELAIEALDGSGDVQDVALVPVTLPVPGSPGPGDAFPAETLVLGSAVFAAPTPTTLTYADIPTVFTSVSVTQEVLAGRARLLPTSGFTTLANQSGEVQLLRPVPAAGEISLDVSDFSAGTGAGDEQVYQWGSAGNYTLDLKAGGTALLPLYATAPVYDPTNHEIGWTQGAGTAVATFTRAYIHGYRDAVPMGHSWGWHVMVPGPRDGELVFPKLPSDGVFDFNSVASDTITITELTAAATPESYAQDLVDVGFGDVAQAIDAAASTNTLVVETVHQTQL